MKEKILKLKKEGYTIDEIAEKLNKSKSTISYHFKTLGINKEYKNFSEDKKLLNEMREFYNKGNSASETAKKFKVSRATVQKYVELRKNVSKTKEEVRLTKIESAKKRRLKLKEMAVEYKGGKCEGCGYDKCVAALDFHHINPEDKEFQIGRDGMSCSWERLKKELDKCVLVCANCHREIHAGVRDINGR